MKALIMIAHGSRREDANAEFISLVKRVRIAATSKCDFVEHCFLEIASPSLAEAMEYVIAKGARTISIFPYFLNSGNHVLRDIPETVDRLTNQYPHCTMTLLPYFGTFEGITELISRQISGET
jgi:sirohydrochlorin cobaltochelatase